MPPRTVLATLNMNYPKPVFDALVHDPTTTENFIFYPTHTTHPNVISAIDALPARLDNLQGVRAYAYCGYGAHDFEADQEKGRCCGSYRSRYSGRRWRRRIGLPARGSSSTTTSVRRNMRTAQCPPHHPTPPSSSARGPPARNSQRRRLSG